jgi:hypothetical protein
MKFQICVLVFVGLIFGNITRNLPEEAYKAFSNRQDTLKIVNTAGLLLPVEIPEKGYKINEYFIFEKDISDSLFQSVKGKRVRINGRLKIVPETVGPVKLNTEGRIYEPYIPSERKCIVRPSIAVIN